MKTFYTNRIAHPLRNLVLFIRANIFREKRSQEFMRWFDDNGDQSLRLNYPLDSQSVVFDLGGYIGDFASDILNRYKCEIHLFEPVPDYHATCSKRFINEPKVHVHPFGLSSNNGTFPIAIAENGSSITAAKDGANLIKVPVQSITDFIRNHDIKKINLLKINIEGGEYEVLPALISSGLIEIIDEIQIQFHDFIPNAEEKRNEIRSKLLNTHSETWCYQFVWENWKRKT